MDSSNIKRITVFAGHYGSGKTNVAVNYAIEVAKLGKKTAIADIDIVNPYFRTKDSERVLADAGIRLISSEYANTNVDTPALPADIYSVFEDKDMMAVVDVGGDDRGALALGRYVPFMKQENDYEMLYVINKYRYLTADAASAVEIMREIEKVSGVRFTGIVNNSNIGEATTCESVLNSIEYAEKVAFLSGLNIKMTTVEDRLMQEISGKVDNLQPIKLYVRQSWLREER